MSQSQPVSEAETNTPVRTQPVNPLKNPSYPQRIHIHERAHWLGVLQSCEDRVAAAKSTLDRLGDRPNQPQLLRLYAQMLGARDQVADAARRLPGEAGDLYEEDHHRLEEAVAALDRVEKLWQAEQSRA